MHPLLDSIPLPVLIPFVVGAILLLCWPRKVIYAISRNRKISESIAFRRFNQLAAAVALGGVLFQIILGVLARKK
jgi:hypothetical protein